MKLYEKFLTAYMVIGAIYSIGLCAYLFGKARKAKNSIPVEDAEFTSQVKKDLDDIAE